MTLPKFKYDVDEHRTSENSLSDYLEDIINDLKESSGDLISFDKKFNKAASTRAVRKIQKAMVKASALITLIRELKRPPGKSTGKRSDGEIDKPKFSGF